MTRPLHIVVVEDHDALREATVEMLEQHDFHALGIASAEDVDDTSLPVPADIYVIDLTLPGEDGLSLAARLRRALPRAGIVITTARTLLDDRLKGYESGADIYLPKPVDPKELLMALRALAHRLSQDEPDSKALTLNKRALVLDGPAGRVKLSESEARLLLAFAAAKDNSLERWQVAALMTGGDAEMSTESMHVRLSQLRRKIQQCGGEAVSIKAKRNTGYRLCIALQVI